MRGLWLLWIVGGYFLGSVMFCKLIPSYFLQKDVAELSDDHNPGAANVFVNCGIPMGLLCLLLDMLKGFLPVYLAYRTVDVHSMYFAAVIVAPVLGHAVAPLNHHHGGKCIATSFGEMLALLPVSRIVLILAGLYVLSSTLIKINPTRIRSIVTFALFGLAGTARSALTGQGAIAVGCALLCVIVIARHTKYFAVVPNEAEK